MDKDLDRFEAELAREQALQNLLKRYGKMLRRTSKNEWDEIENDIYETTRVTIDNLTADDL